MNKKEENIQKALGTFDHLKCVQCGKVSYKAALAVNTYETIYEIGGPSFRVCTGVEYKCECGSEEFEEVSEIIND